MRAVRKMVIGWVFMLCMSGCSCSPAVNLVEDRTIEAGASVAAAYVPMGGDSLFVRLPDARGWHYSRITCRYYATDSVTVYGPWGWRFSQDAEARDVDGVWFRMRLPVGEDKLVCCMEANGTERPRSVTVELEGVDGRTFRMDFVQKAGRKGRVVPVPVKETAVYVPGEKLEFSVGLTPGVWTYLTRTSSIYFHKGKQRKAVGYWSKVHREDSLKARRLYYGVARYIIDFMPGEGLIHFKSRTSAWKSAYVSMYEMKTVRPASLGGKEEIGDETIYVVLCGKPDE